jgi:ABC-type multidrug transport system fused ATPase/permease subunit
VIEAGRVVESGRHAALMERAGIYRRLVERQLVKA